ncbi:MAG TPA: Glu-tRNA(Gln) amidotransferase GatDE subunit E, partial [Candidatus Aenigmarchaeota archaeon]|nr:Glu-tRNA(Gln) amidotransferase GatDE subunit E [Candidatus Aenigmarchaeota archaeon]
GVGGIIHTDEDVSKYQLEEDFKKVKEVFDVNEDDCIVIVMGDEETIKKAADAVVRRANYCLIGVPEETRIANPDGTTSFTRPLPGGARMYPETDLPPVIVTSELIKEIMTGLPEKPEEKIRRYQQLGLNYDISKELILEEKDDIFEKFKDKVRPTFLANVLVGIVKNVERETKREVPKEKVVEVLEALARGELIKEAIEPVLTYLANNPERSVKDAIKELSLTPISLKELERIVKEKMVKNEELLRQVGSKAEKVLLGLVMKEVRGRIEIKHVVNVVKKMVNRFLKL